MDWYQIAALCISGLGSIVAVLIWSWSENRNVERHRQTELMAILGIVDSIRQDVKDFHGRLCSLEERRKGEK